jgi:Tfp pilus assembly protein PilV
MKLNFPIRPQPADRAAARCERAFSLIEVMIAAAIFFLAVFAILGLVSQTLGNARRLQRPQVDASPVLAQYASTNKLVEGTYSGNLSEMLGDAYRNYNWTAEVTEVASNKLFSVECAVQAVDSREVISDLTTVLYRPKSDPGSLDGGNFIHR